MDNEGEAIFSPNLYFDSSFDIEAAKILPGEYFVTKRDMVLVTVLGSCVAACIRDRVSGIGGMNHFMLPDSSSDNSSPTGTSARYGTYAMEMMINQLLKSGARRSNLEAKVFGGGSVIRGMVTVNVGTRNAEFALDYLHTEGIAVAGQDLLGEYARKVYFFPYSGRVLVKKIRTLHNETIIEREQAYRSKLKGADIQGDVELF
ncbi:MAG TPA: chemoreceptor glutamine deamidase CheD [Gallionellaceae bacterium]|nr:chemoreceptor glutamine deamidase CheD [Gallionellaceae bacterium]